MLTYRREVNHPVMPDTRVTARRATWTRRGWRRGRVMNLSATLVLATGLSLTGPASSGATPDANSATIAQAARNFGDGSGSPGLRISVVNGRRFGIATPVHVLSFAGPHYKVAIDLARHAVDNGVQTPSSMCRTTRGCVAAVNGDFFNMTPPGKPDPADTVGGIIRNCVILHTPQISHQQVDLDSHTVSQDLNWSSTIDVKGVSVPIDAINQELPMSYVKVHLALSGTLLYTPAYALKVPAAKGRVTYYFAHVGSNISPTRINTTAQLELVATTTRSFKVAPGHIAISATRSTALASLTTRDVAIMSTVSSAGCDNIGGHPILLDHGIVAPIDPADTFLMKPYARTTIGWTASGTTIIMTVDGRDGVSGATVLQLVALLQSLHVVTAIALDGGNSTTFYAEGRVLNRPSHGKERPVGTGLLVLKS